MEDIDRSLSIKLYDVMDNVGVSEKIRKLYQDTAIISEIITTIEIQMTGGSVTFYIFGSHSEGSTIEGLNSDIDGVYCHEGWPVIDNIHAAPHDISYIMVRDNHTYPGYVKLQRVINGTPSTIFNTTIFKTKMANDFDIDTEGRICRRHFIMCKDKHAHERHGPADSAPGQSVCKDQDNVFALRCRTIPNYAQAWLHRQRRYNWPSRNDLQKMCDLGCFVVGVGHTSSREQQIEWRMSFSLQERLLMFSLNPAQHKCYVLLKIIKNDIVKADIGESISSYHCKTCILYAIESTQAAIWRPENIMCCVRLCLMILLTWVLNGVCPNYFIPLENMFEKPQFLAKRYRLLEILKTIIAEEMSIILRFQCGDIRNRILQPGTIPSNMTDTIVYTLYLHLYGKINRFSKTIYISRKLYVLYKNCTATCQNVIMVLAKYIELLTSMRVITEHTEQQSSDAISFVIPVLHQHIAHRLASLACKGQSQEHAHQLLHLSIHHFQHGDYTDLMTSKLLAVSVLLPLEKVCDACANLLEDIEHDIKRYVVTHCGCHNSRFIYNVDLMQYLGTHNVPSKAAIRTMYVGCVRFTRSDTEIAPLPLQYEMYRSLGAPPRPREEHSNWFDLAAVDGKVYLYFLQYLVYSRLNRPSKEKGAIDKLVWVIGDDPNLYHRETAYNLLGWIHVQEGWIPEALRCFLTSWNIRPVHNAASWHLCIALYKHYTR